MLQESPYARASGVIEDFPYRPFPDALTTREFPLKSYGALRVWRTEAGGVLPIHRPKLERIKEFSMLSRTAVPIDDGALRVLKLYRKSDEGH